MAAILKHWREAATLIILAPTSRFQPTLSGTPQQPQPISQRPHNGKTVQDYETLLLKRSSKSTFMPNLHVFPGGTSENTDFSSEWISVFEKLGKDFQQSMFQKVSRGCSKAAPMFTRSRDVQYSKIPPEVAFRISAIRETFEESGLLIVKTTNEMKANGNGNALLSEEWNQSSCLSSSDNDLKLQKWRERVNENPENFLAMCKEMDLIPDILSLYEWTDWLTPTALGGRRYDTIFYICCLGSKPEAKEDSVETVTHQWVTPFSILSSYHEGNVGLAPPQVYELSRMLHFNAASDLMQFSADREPERVERLFPVIAMCEDAVISLFPGDDLYPETPDLYTPRNVINFGKPMEEVNKGVKRFHRSIAQGSKFGSLSTVACNIEFENKHIGPFENFAKLLSKL